MFRALNRNRNKGSGYVSNNRNMQPYKGSPMNRQTNMLQLAGLLMVLALTSCASGKATAPSSEPSSPGDNIARISSLDIDRQQSQTLVSIEGEGKLTPMVQKLFDPPRLVVDFSDAVGDDLPPVQVVEDGLIEVITANTLVGPDNHSVRLLFGLEQDLEYAVRDTDGKLVLVFDHPEGYVAEAPQKEVQEESKEEIASEPVAAVAVAPVVEEPVETPVELPKLPECVDGEPVVLHQAQGASNATVSGLHFKANENGGVLDVRSNKPLTDDQFTLLRLCDPDRLVVDLPGAKAQKSVKRTYKGDGTYLEGIRVGKHSQKVRIVLDLKQPLPMFDFTSEKRSNHFAFTLPEEPKVAPETAIAAAPIPEPVKEEVLEEPKPEVVEAVDPIASVVNEPVQVAEKKEEIPSSMARLDALEFRHAPNRAVVEMKLDKVADYRLVSASDDQLVLELPNTMIPSHLEQSLDTSEFNGPVKLVSSFNSTDGESMSQIVIHTSEKVANRVWNDNNTLYWEFDFEGDKTAQGSGEGKIAVNAAGDTVIEYADEQTAPMGEGASANPYAAEEFQYRDPLGDASGGQRISLELKNADILDVLRLISDVSKLNIITSDVAGTVTVRLLNVPWKQALEIILRSKGLDMERKGNIIRVAPIEVLAAERDIKQKMWESEMESIPLHLRLIPVSYSSATDLFDDVSQLLSERGKVSVDERMNVLIVKDMLENVLQIEQLVAKLDMQTPQVSIEAKIVEADVRNVKGFGIQWGGYYQMSALTGNSTGLAFPSNLGINGGQDLTNTPGVPTAGTPDYVVNVPIATSTSGIGMQMGSANNAASLSLRIQSAEVNGKLRVISSPKITTLDNTAAVIEQGIRIPVTTISATGQPNSKMVPALLRLKVLPHITADGSIIMKLNIEKDEADFSRQNERTKDPAIVSKKVQTEVLVRTGETAVIGGIYTKKLDESSQGVPGLMHIPILGWIFKNYSSTQEKTELLVFITPRIMTRTQSSMSMN